MAKKALVYILIAVVIIAIAIAAMAFLSGKPRVNTTSVTTEEPILLYGAGLPYTLYNLSFSTQNLSVIQLGSVKYFSYGSFKPASLINAAILLGSFNSSVKNVSFEYFLHSPRLFLAGINNSFGNESLEMPMTTNTLLYNGIILGLRLFPLEYYSSAPTIVLKGALYPAFYDAANAGINSSVRTGLEYNISPSVPVSVSIKNGTLSLGIINDGNSMLELEDIEIAGYFMGSENATIVIPNITVPKLNYTYLIGQIGSEGINISRNSTVSYLQTSAAKVNALEDKANSGEIKNVSQFYSDFNSTINVTRLEYLESLMGDNHSYYVAMHFLNNFNPYNTSVQELASRISAWNNAYLGLLDLNVSASGTLAMPASVEATNATYYSIPRTGNVTLTFNISSINYLGQRVYPINGTNYTVFAYFNGVRYADSEYKYND